MKVGDAYFKANNLRDLCTSSEINKWSEYKPLNIDTGTGEISIEQSRKLNCGMTPVRLDKLLTSCMDYPGEQTEYTPEDIISDGLEWEYTMRPPFNQPLKYFPYRLNDFKYYNHDTVGNDAWEDVTFMRSYITALSKYKSSFKDDHYSTFNHLYLYNGLLNRNDNVSGFYNPEEVYDIETGGDEEFDAYIYTDSAFDLAHITLEGGNEKWYWAVAVYVPELKKWGLFYAPSDIVASFQYNWVTTPALHTNTDLLYWISRSKETKLTCIPVLVNSTKITEDTIIYSAPSGKPFTFNIDDRWWYGEDPLFTNLIRDEENIYRFARRLLYYDQSGWHVIVHKHIGEFDTNGNNTRFVHYNLILAKDDTDRSKRSREEGGLQNYEIDLYLSSYDGINGIYPWKDNYKVKFTYSSLTQNGYGLTIPEDGVNFNTYWGIIVDHVVINQQYPHLEDDYYQDFGLKVDNLVVNAETYKYPYSQISNKGTVNKFKKTSEKFSDLWHITQNKNES